MPKKLTQDYVKKQFKKYNWVLHSKYVNSKTKLKCTCENGHTVYITWGAFQHGYRCRKCYSNRNKLPQKFVKEYFKKHGWVLHSKYINSTTKMKCTCENGHIIYITWHSFKGGSRCKICYNEGRKLTQKFIKEQLDKHGWVLHSKYVNSDTKMKCTCKNGHTVHIKWSNFQSGNRCKQCALEKSRLTQNFIEEQLSKHGWVLHSKYVNSKTKLKCTCENGHTVYITWNNFQHGVRCKECSFINRKGKQSSLWKGGKNVASYDTFVERLSPYHKTSLIIKDGIRVLGVECKYCGKIFPPTRTQVDNRILVINGNYTGANNFYCSDSCKEACPTYRKIKYPKGFKKSTSREVQPQLRKLVLKRDNYKCQICEATTDEEQLHCHHITGVEKNPIESADIDNCITLCKSCHKKVHKLPDCGYHELICKNRR